MSASLIGRLGQALSDCPPTSAVSMSLAASRGQRRRPGGYPGLLLGAFFLKATGREGPAFLRTFECIYVG